MIKVYRASDLEPIINGEGGGSLEFVSTLSPQFISPYYLNMLEEKFIIPEEFDTIQVESNASLCVSHPTTRKGQGNSPIQFWENGCLLTLTQI